MPYKKQIKELSLIKDLFNKLNDDEIENLLNFLTKYSKYIHRKFKSKKLPRGLDHEDIVQEIIKRILNGDLYYDPERSLDLKEIIASKIENYYIYLFRLKESKIKKIDIEEFDTQETKFEIERFDVKSTEKINEDKFSKNIEIIKKYTKNNIDLKILELLILGENKKQISIKLSIKENRIDSAMIKFKSIIFREKNKDIIEWI